MKKMFATSCGHPGSVIKAAAKKLLLTAALRGHFFFLAIVILAAAPHVFGQCSISANATLDETAGTVTLHATNSGTCGTGHFDWLFEGFEYFPSCPNGVPACTVEQTYSTCSLADGTHAFQVTGTCGNPGPNGSCPTTTPPRISVPFVVDQKPVANISASRIGPSRFHITVDYTFKQAPGREVYVAMVNGPIIYDAGQGPFLSGTRSFDYTFGCQDSVPLMAVVTACNGDQATGQTTVTLDQKPNMRLSLEKDNTTGSRVAVLDVAGGADVATVDTTLQSIDADTGQAGYIANFGLVGISAFPIRRPVGANRQILRLIGVNLCKTGRAERTVEAESCNGCPTQAGGPVQLWDGAMTYSERDPVPSDIGKIFTRSYASNNSHDGLFGIGWWTALDSFTADVSIDSVTSRLVHGVNDDRALFQPAGSVWVQTYPTSRTTRATLTGSAAAGFSYRGAGSSIVQLFGANGKIIGWRDLAQNRRVAVTYDASGKPSRIFDEAGTWSCTVTTSGGHVVQISVDGRSDLVWNYAYTNGRLQSVSLVNAAAPWRTYEYGGGGQLATIRDALGNPIEQHSYDSLGRATSSLDASGDITLFQYLNGATSALSSTVITRADGSQTTYEQSFIGRDVTTHMDGGCSSCGGNDSTSSFDSDGHVLRVQDGRGYIVANTYGASGNLTDVTTALVPSGCDPATDTNLCRLTSAALTTATLTQTSATDTVHYDYLDPNWPDRATRTTRKSVSPGQSVVETFSFDGVTGQTLQHAVSGLTDSDLHLETHTTTTTLYNGTETATFQPGGLFQSGWLSLPQPVGLRKSMDGPRTDVADVTTFVYYPIDNSVTATWRGRLAAVKDAGKHFHV